MGIILHYLPDCNYPLWYLLQSMKRMLYHIPTAVLIIPCIARMTVVHHNKNKRQEQ